MNRQDITKHLRLDVGPVGITAADLIDTQAAENKRLKTAWRNFATAVGVDPDQPDFQHVVIEKAKAQAVEIERLDKENTTLRGIATAIMPCHYCGVDEIAKCPKGFPGCSLADDGVALDRLQAAEIERMESDSEIYQEAMEQLVNTTFGPAILSNICEAGQNEIRLRISYADEQRKRTHVWKQEAAQAASTAHKGEG